MRERPDELTDAAVLAAVAAGWGGVDRVAHLPLGFGAHHWRAAHADRPVWFATYDRAEGRRAAELADAHEAALRLAEQGLAFIVAPTARTDGAQLLPVAHGVLSCTPWLDGVPLPADAFDEPGTLDEEVEMLQRLHAAAAPASLRRWGPVPGEEVLGRLREATAERWEAGPLGEDARIAIVARLDAIADWVGRHRDLATVAGSRRWVPTHGETQPANQLRTPAGILLVDWESVRLAPWERDLAALVAAGHAERVDPDPAMLELFALDRRLGEIDGFARWFRAPHAGSADDRIAFAGLQEELAGGR